MAVTLPHAASSPAKIKQSAFCSRVLIFSLSAVMYRRSGYQSNLLSASLWTFLTQVISKVDVEVDFLQGKHRPGLSLVKPGG